MRDGGRSCSMLHVSLIRCMVCCAGLHNLRAYRGMSCKNIASNLTRSLLYTTISSSQYTTDRV